MLGTVTTITIYTRHGCLHPGQVCKRADTDKLIIILTFASTGTVEMILTRL